MVGVTHNWSGMANGTCLRGVAITISSKLGSADVEGITVDERFMRLRLKNTLGSKSLVVVYAPTEVCDTEEEEILYPKLALTRDQCSPIVMCSLS